MAAAAPAALQLPKTTSAQVKWHVRARVEDAAQTLTSSDVQVGGRSRENQQRLCTGSGDGCGGEPSREARWVADVFARLFLTYLALPPVDPNIRSAGRPAVGPPTRPGRQASQDLPPLRQRPGR